MMGELKFAAEIVSDAGGAMLPLGRTQDFPGQRRKSPCSSAEIAANSRSSAASLVRGRGSCASPFRVMAIVFAALLLGSSAEAGLRAGAATSNITPSMGVRLDGTILQVGPAKGVHDELHARCLVIDDGEERVAIVVCDNTMIAQFVLDDAKAIIERQSGLVANRVLISATHTHSAPRAIGISDEPEDKAYLKFMARRIADGVQRAINNLAPAEIGWGGTDAPEFVHNRRWFVEGNEKTANPFGRKGEPVRMNPGRNGLVKPAGPVDAELFILSVRHADGRPMALLANYGLHYIGGIPRGVVSADYFGVFADHVQELLMADRQDPPFVGIMSNGTSGDINAINFKGERQRFKAYERMIQVGRALADKAVAVCRGIEHRSDLTLDMREVELPLKIRKPDAARLKWAEPLYASGQSKFDGGKRLTRPEVYAREAMHLKDYPDVARIKLQAIRIGDLGIGSIPCEVFAETGLGIKDSSPTKATFTIELANGFWGYLPTPQQHQWGGYETWPARSSCLEIQAEPKIRKAVLGMLEEMHAGR